jgi:4-hydroxybenzoate polyprenyltransferase
MQALAGLSPLSLGAHAVVGGVSTVLWTFLIRIEDDIADASHDMHLGRAGDQRYAQRPIVTGSITVPELKRLYLFCLSLLLLLNLGFGLSIVFFTCTAGWLITWLGFRWFFIPNLRRYASPLAYLVRKSLTVLFGLYALALFVDGFGMQNVSLWFIPLLLAPWAGVSAWETARKIRAPGDETDYDTYSKQLGWQRAIWLPVLFTSVSAACISIVSRAAGLGWEFPAILMATTVFTIGVYLRFRIQPTPSHAKMKPYAELYGLVAHGGLMLTLVLVFGVTVK